LSFKKLSLYEAELLKELLIGILGDRLSIFQLTLLRFSSKILNNTKIIEKYAFADR
jgi:hypothetical protein